MINTSSQIAAKSIDCSRNPFGYRPSLGFTLVELVIVIAVAGVLSSISFVSYREWADRELLKSSAQALIAWLDERRTQAMAAMVADKAGACIININSSLKQLSAAESISSVRIGTTDTNTYNTCQSSNNLNLSQLTSRSSDITLTASGDNPNQLIFTFRGTSPINSSANSSAPYTEFKIEKVNHSSAVCVKVIKPLGLMRLGISRSQSADCDYSQFYSDSRRGQ